METTVADLPVMQKSKLTLISKETPPASACCAPGNNASPCCTPSVTQEENGGACCAQPGDGSPCCDK